MFIQINYLFILILMACFCLPIDYFYKCIIGLSLIILILLYFYYTRKNLHTQDIQGATVSELYNTLEEGDIVFLKEYRETLHFLNYYNMNKGIYHTGIITHVNGIKHILHSYPIYPGTRMFHPECILHQYEYVGVPWVIIQEPLLDYMMIYPSIYQVFRHPSSPKIKLYKNVIKKQKHYCTFFIGELLSKNGIIDRCSRFYFNYDVNELVQLLLQKGYKTFYIKQQ